MKYERLNFRIRKKPAKVNLNHASFEELIRLPYIGDITASKIIEFRRQARFRQIEDLIQKVGLSERAVITIKDWIEF